MEYQVPQFIEIEDKIVGPFTLRQFIYLAGGAGICSAFFFLLPFILAVLLAIPFGAFALALAFYKVNGRPFINVVESAVSYYTGSKLFLWKHDETTQTAAKEAPVAPPPSRGTPRLTGDKLHELAWSLDVKSREPEK